MLAAPTTNLTFVARVNEVLPVNPAMPAVEAPLALFRAGAEQADRALAGDHFEPV